jgi:hypothetical protein
VTLASVTAARAAAIAGFAVVAMAGGGCADESARSDRNASAPLERTVPDQTHEQPNRDARRGRGRSDQPQYRAELARIERAEPAPRREPVSGKQLEDAKRVRTPGGGWAYIVPTQPSPTATAPTPGCDAGSPQPPGLTARRIDQAGVLVTYRMGGGDENCRAEWVLLTLDVSDDLLSGDQHRLPLARKRWGQIVLPVPRDLADADILVARTRTEKYSGVASRTTTIEIR